MLWGNRKASWPPNANLYIVFEQRILLFWLFSTQLTPFLYSFWRVAVALRCCCKGFTLTQAWQYLVHASTEKLKNFSCLFLTPSCRWTRSCTWANITRLCVGEGQLHTAQHEDRSSQQSKGRLYSHLLCTDEAMSGILHQFQMPHYKRNVNKVARALHRPPENTRTCCVPGEAEGPDSVQPGEDKADCSHRCTTKGQPAMVLTGNRETDWK